MMQHNEILEAMAEEFRNASFRAKVWPPEPGYTTAWRLDFWLSPTDRYLADTLWAPNDADDRWTWGPNFEHSRPADIDPIQLAAAFLNTLIQRQHRSQ